MKLFLADVAVYKTEPAEPGVLARESHWTLVAIKRKTLRTLTTFSMTLEVTLEHGVRLLSPSRLVNFLESEGQGRGTCKNVYI